MVGTPEYQAWINMVRRCLRPQSRYFGLYGGRGISVCSEWMRFERFSEDMGPRPSPEHSLDRINNDGNYEPGNCRWATRTQQGRNKRTNLLLTHEGETLTVTAWAERTGINRSTLAWRAKRGLDPFR